LAARVDGPACHHRRPAGRTPSPIAGSPVHVGIASVLELLQVPVITPRTVRQRYHRERGPGQSPGWPSNRHRPGMCSIAEMEKTVSKSAEGYVNARASWRSMRYRLRSWPSAMRSTPRTARRSSQPGPWCRLRAQPGARNSDRSLDSRCPRTRWPGRTSRWSRTYRVSAQRMYSTGSTMHLRRDQRRAQRAGASLRRTGADPSPLNATVLSIPQHLGEADLVMPIEDHATISRAPLRGETDGGGPAGHRSG